MKDNIALIKKLLTVKHRNENLPRIRRTLELFLWDFGFFNTVDLHKPVDKYLNPIPWLSYPSIEFLNRLDYSKKTIFEFGAGNSSLYFSNLGAKVFSVEDNADWYKELIKTKHKKNTFYLAAKKEEYVKCISKPKLKFDLILIDGIYRYSSAIEAVSYLKPKGLIILDNSEWFPKAFDYLLSKGFTHVDFSGFTPFNDYTSTTSFFFKPGNVDFNFSKAKKLRYSIGSVHQVSKEDR